MLTNEDKKQNKQRKYSYLPQGWCETHLCEVCEKPQSGYSPNGSDQPAQNNRVGVLKLNAIHGSRFSPGQNKAVEISKVDKLKTPVSKDTLIVSRSNTKELVGTVCYIERDYPDLYLSDLLWRVSAKSDQKIDLKWLSYLLSFGPYRAKILARAQGTSGTMKKITKSGFLGIQIVCPELKEQKIIAKVLTTWDTAIDHIRDLAQAKKNRKKALMQQLLVGEKRLSGFNQPWKEIYLGDLFNERKETHNEHLPLLAITAKRGLIIASDIDRKDASSADKSKYKRIAPGDIGYNTMRMWQGVSAVSDMEGIVSPAYTICVPKKGLNVIFTGYLFKLPSVVNLFGRYSQGLVSDTLTLKFRHFAQIKLRIPNLLEQNAISKALSTVDAEIRLQDKILTFTKKQKNGLMQKLLTGEIRVKT